MKSTEYYAFEFRHRINLEEYLKAHYNLCFKKSSNTLICTTDPDLSISTDGEYENTWLRKNIKQGTTNKHGVFLRAGNVMDWESLEHDCSPTEVVSIIKNKKKSLSGYKSLHYTRLESLFNRVATRFRHSINPSVTAYLTKRNIKHSSLAGPFQIGSPESYDKLINSLTTPQLPLNKVRDLLKEIYIVRRSPNYKYLSFTPSIIVPVYSVINEVVGFHGRRINPGRTKRYFNTGFLHDLITEILYGENRSEIRSAIKQKKQVILTKGIFDFFTCYQDNHHQVLATLNQGVSIHQFDRLIGMTIDEIIIGFESARERSNIIGLMGSNLKKIKLSIPQTNKDIDAEISSSGVTLDQLMKNVKSTAQADKEATRLAAIKHRKHKMDTLAEAGHTFLIRNANILKEIKSAKGTHRRLKDFLKIHAQNNLQVIPKGTAYIRIAKTFVNDSILDQFKSELRTLLLLLIKSYPKSGTINYTNTNLRKELKIGETTLIEHKNRLIASGYLMVDKKVAGKNKSPKGKTIRNIKFIYYPSTIKF